MVRASNFVLGLLNIMSLLLGLAAIASSVYFRVHGGTVCQKALQNPLLIMGVFLFVVSLLGFVGSCCRVNIVLKLYLVAMFLLIVGLVGFTAFMFVVTNTGAGKAVSGFGFKEHRLGDYSNWLRNHFVNDKNWDEIRSCLIEAQVCRSLDHNVDEKLEDFVKKNLSPIQSGCCKPPISCGFGYNNGTSWTVPESVPAVEDSDCNAWSNNQQTLCYNCNSCKAGVLANIKKQWRMLAIVNIVIILILIVIYSTGCCVRRNNREDEMCGRYKAGYV
ncbi:Tetraspannin domain-containing protein [Cephalotus follicularis]|uniref:Tetraspannin domain-containing protein n=1 Tax=Cephalotus follicularis TaxID=3775 RepID=A0A1Q3CVU0_CEPFO|nr:Tetraspannin domain-containing protein [Cephalotus follicularis]